MLKHHDDGLKEIDVVEFWDRNQQMSGEAFHAFILHPDGTKLASGILANQIDITCRSYSRSESVSLEKMLEKLESRPI